MDSNTKSAQSPFGGISKITIIGGAIIFLTLLVCLYFSVLASINSNANKEKVKKLEEKPEYIEVDFKGATYEKTSAQLSQNFYNVLEGDKSQYKSNKLSVDNNGFITLSENKLYRITYKARLQNQGNRNEYVLIFVTTEKNNTLSSSLIIYETEQLIDEARGGGTGSFLYDTTKLPLNERKIRPGISLQYTTAVGNKFNVKSTEGQSVFTINEVK